ncbi:MAG: HDOD domain-containing protein [Methylococcaceae bacterium]|nr:HDOD domain-containing protein [Methylococcaceae bacterium]
MTAKELVQGSIELVSFPDIALKINGMIDDPCFNAGDLGEVIAQDPGLTARLLKIANSPYYGFQARIDTVARAIALIGTQDLRNLILATSAVDTFTRIPQDLVDMTDFWIRSVQCGILARSLARQCSVLKPEALFVAGLLSDIGSLVMYHKIPDECREILLAVGDNRRIVGDLEQEILGFTHADVAVELTELWCFPEPLRAAIGRHLNPLEIDEHWLDANLVYLATRLCDVSIQGRSIDAVFAEIPFAVLQGLRLTRDQVVHVIEDLGTDFSRVFDLIIPDCERVY